MKYLLALATFVLIAVIHLDQVDGQTRAKPVRSNHNKYKTSTIYQQTSLWTRHCNFLKLFEYFRLLKILKCYWYIKAMKSSWMNDIYCAKVFGIHNKNIYSESAALFTFKLKSRIYVCVYLIWFWYLAFALNSASMVKIHIIQEFFNYFKLKCTFKHQPEPERIIIKNSFVYV